MTHSAARYRQFRIEMRKQRTAARRFPFQLVAKCGCIDGHQHEVALPREMPGCRFRDLRGGREMDVAVAQVDRRPAEARRRLRPRAHSAALQILKMIAIPLSAARLPVQLEGRNSSTRYCPSSIARTPVLGSMQQTHAEREALHALCADPACRRHPRDAQGLARPHGQRGDPAIRVEGADRSGVRRGASQGARAGRATRARCCTRTPSSASASAAMSTTVPPTARRTITARAGPSTARRPASPR